MELMTRHIAGAGLHLRDDGATVDGLIVPYGRPADVHDVATGDRYREVFTPASFAGWLQRSAGAAHRVGLNLEHGHGVDDRIGYGQAFDTIVDDDGVTGLGGSFRLYRDPARLDKLRDMLATSHGGMSIEFAARRYRLAGDAREWVGAQLFGVAATPAPQHPGARVLAVRAGAALDEPSTPRLDAAMARWQAAAVPSAANV